MTRTLCFVEFEDELQTVLHARSEGREMILVPLTERVRVQAVATGCRIITVDDLLTNQTHLRVLTASERYQANLATLLEPDRFTAAGCGTLKHHARFLVQYAMVLTDLVITALAIEPEAGLIAVKGPFNPSGTGNIRFGSQRLLWRIIKAVAVSRHRQFHLLNGVPDETGLRCAAEMFHQMLLRGFNRLLLLAWKNRPVVLVPGLGYGMSRFADILIRHGFHVVVAREGSRDALRDLGGAIWSLLKSVLGIHFGPGPNRHVLGVLSIPTSGKLNEIWRGLGRAVLEQGVKFRGVDLTDVVREKLITDILPVAARSAELVEAYQCLFKRFRPNAIISQVSRWENGAAIGEAGTAAGLPTLLISHGSHVLPRNRIESVSHRDHANGLLYDPAYQIAVVQSPLAEKALMGLAPGHPYLRCEPVMWGYHTVTGAHPRADEAVILHAGTAKPRWGWRPWWYETTEEYIAGLIHLIHAVERLGGVRLVIRYRPSADCTLEDLQARLPPNPRVTVKSDGSFLDDLATTDLLVSFSSTTIEEALRARCPVVQFGGNGRYQHLPGVVWGDEPPRRAAVYSVKQSAVLEQALRWILGEHHGRPLTDDDLRDYLFKPGEALTADELAECLAHPDRLKKHIVQRERVDVNASAGVPC